VRASEYLEVVWARKWIILSAMLIVSIGAVVASHFQSAQYRSDASLLFSQRNTGAAILGVPQTQLSNVPEVELATQVDLIRQPRIARQVIGDLGLSTSPEQLLKRVSVTTDGKTSIITISAADGTPTGAAAIANGFASAYAQTAASEKRRSIEAAAAEVQRSLASTERQIASLGAGGANTVQAEATRELYRTLVAQLQMLEVSKGLETGPVSIVDTATPDAVPVSPKPVRNGALGLAIGLVLGLAMAFLANTLDDTIRSAEEASTLCGAPVLGQIPLERFEEGESQDVTVLARPASPAAESYRDLRNKLQFVFFGQSPKTLLVTSAIPGEGKSAVAVNLSVMLAQAGQRVALVFADFRHPPADGLLGLAHSPGLSDVLRGTCELSAAIQQALPNMHVLLPGEMPTKPGELLGSVAMKQLLASLSEYADIIIIDTPPLLADAASTARWSDGALVVTRVGLTTREAARKVRAHLEGVGTPVVGVVVVGLEDTGAGHGGYYSYAGYGA
jgi:capsular exopolysaccharide synthesis family protein